jgi:uncharacterized lipoprotein YbaY
MCGGRISPGEHNMRRTRQVKVGVWVCAVVACAQLAQAQTTGSADAAQSGMTFYSRLDGPVMIGGQVVLPRGAAVVLRRRSNRPAETRLQFTLNAAVAVRP